MVVEVVADLGRDHHLVAHVTEGVSEEGLAFARAVGIRGVEVVDTPLFSVSEESYGSLVVHLSPPAGRDRPHPEAYLGDRYIGVAQRAIFHLPPPVRFQTLEQYPIIYHILTRKATDFHST